MPKIEQPLIWTTRDGREIPVVDMENDHLIKTNRFLRRRNDVFRSQQGLDEILAEELPMFAALLAEAAARELLARIYED